MTAAQRLVLLLPVDAALATGGVWIFRRRGKRLSAVRRFRSPEIRETSVSHAAGIAF